MRFQIGIAPCSPSLLPTVPAATFIRKMRGDSQAILVEDPDGYLYVVKMSGNLSGSGSLASELIGGLLCGALGLSVPTSCLVQISDQFLDRYLDSWFHTSKGQVRPPAGLHYGAAFVGTTSGVGRPLELPGGASRTAVDNCEQFCGMYIFDIWANHLARRQKLYLTDVRRQTLHAVFLDNGLLFGHPPWPSLTSLSQAEFRRKDAVYVQWRSSAVLAWLKKFRAIIPNALTDALKLVPREWYMGDLANLEHCLLQRLGVIEEILKPFALVDEDCRFDGQFLS